MAAKTPEQIRAEKRANRKPPLTIENAKIIWRNFSGRQTQYNAKGKRNFNIVVPAEDVAAMKRDGWNVKTKDPRPEFPDDEPLNHLAVNVNYSANSRPPRVVLIAGEDRTELDETTIDMLDRVQIENVDLIINPSYYDVNGNTGYTAYLQAIYVTIVQDDLEKKYGSFMQDSAPSDDRRGGVQFDDPYTDDSAF